MKNNENRIPYHHTGALLALVAKNQKVAKTVQWIHF